MKLNGIDLKGRTPQSDSVLFVLGNTDVETVAALSGKTLIVTDDEGTEVERYDGYVTSSIAVEGDRVNYKVIRKLDANSEAAIKALEANVQTIRASVDATTQTVTEAKGVADEAKATADDATAKADEAKAAALTGTPAMREAMQLAISAADLAPEDYAGFADLYDPFDPEVKYKKGRMVTYEVGVYRCIKNNASTIGTTPDVDSEHWERVDVAADGVEVWDAEKSYDKGDRVHYPTEADPVYVSQKNNNSVEPGTDEKYWTKEA